MSLQDLYQRFLADPKSAPLAADVALIYVTTTTKVEKPDSVVSHLTKQQQKIVKKKSENVIGVVEGPDSLCLDVDTTLEFVSGGGAYLPSIDDNFLADRVATFPTVHIVRFNDQKEIQQVRIYWDQGSLLKQVEIIGHRARAWPIRDAKDQTRLIKTAIEAQPAAAAAPVPAPDLPAKNEGNTDESGRPASPGKRYIKDPYAAGSLFDLLSPGSEPAASVHAPRAPASAKPPPREYSELFVGHDETPEKTPSKPAVAPKIGAGKNFQPSRLFDNDETVAAERAEEPRKTVAPKAGSGHNYRPSRLFDDDETVAAENSDQTASRAHSKRYDHFELGADNSEREVKPKPGRPLSRHTAQWGFEDFATPEKPKREPRGQEVRHFAWSDDEADPETPPARPRVAQPRRDAETHFQLTDDAQQEGSRVISSFQNKGLSLYKNNLYDEEDEPVKGEHESKAPLSTVTGNNPNRKKDFESHWSATDSSPADGKTHHDEKPVRSDRMRHVKMMESSWEPSDDSPQPSKVAAAPQRRSMRDVNQRSWNFDD